MGSRVGDFIWYELITSDADAASAFYTSILGWDCADSGQVEMDYRLFTVGGSDIAGLLAMPAPTEESAMQPVWLGYIAVDDVDTTVSAVIAAGGSVHMPATDIPSVGRIAMLADPQGVLFYVMRAALEACSTAFSSTEPGRCSWNELSSDDLPAALDFYTSLFGWAKGDAMDMGELGDYQFISQNDQTIGAMMSRPPSSPRSMWTFYFRVADIDTAAQRISVAGGTILHGPAEVPGGDHIIIGIDPQGAKFALVGARSGVAS